MGTGWALTGFVKWLALSVVVLGSGVSVVKFMVVFRLLCGFYVFRQTFFVNLHAEFVSEVRWLVFRCA